MRSFHYFCSILLMLNISATAQLIIDHNCTDISVIPSAAIELAKEKLHIAYGHTSHGSQITTGMTGLISFANNGGRGLAHTEDIFKWNNGGTDGALDLHDKAMDDDVGYWPQWYDNTIAYLENPDNNDVNLIMWSWCGQVGTKYTEGKLWDEFLGPMTELELTYPNVTFVYMTGHLSYWSREEVNAANDSIRSYCRNNNKVLYDFADIESYGPDGTPYKDVGNDNCDYYDGEYTVVGNWAKEYQDSHVNGVDWYTCTSAHSEPLNANLKAYAAWYMFASLAGWNSSNPPLTNDLSNTLLPELSGKVYPNPSSEISYLELDRDDNENIQVDLISADGKALMRKLQPISDGIKTFYEVNTTDLAPGIYYIKVKTTKVTSSYKILVIR